jgi:hypothetical protein
VHLSLKDLCTVSHICGVTLVDEIALHHRSHDAATDQSAPKSSHRCHHRPPHHPQPHTMCFQIYFHRQFPTSCRPAAQRMIYQTLKSEKNKLDEMFRPQDCRFYCSMCISAFSFFCTHVHSSDGPHNSDHRPGAHGRSEGDHSSLWGFPFGLKHPAFYMHIYADQSATFGPDTCKVLVKDLCDLLGEVGIFAFSLHFQDLVSSVTWVQQQQNSRT